MAKTKKGNSAVFSIFKNRAELESAVNALRAEGFRPDDISVLFSSPATSKEFAHENTTKLPEGAATGAVTGAAVGGVLGWLAGIGSLAIPGVGPFIAAGPIMAALGGMGVGGSVGTLAGALVGLGMPEYEAKRYEGIVSKGGILLSVHVDDSEWSEKARDILEAHGGEDISEKYESGKERTSPMDSRHM